VYQLSSIDWVWVGDCWITTHSCRPTHQYCAAPDEPISIEMSSSSKKKCVGVTLIGQSTIIFDQGCRAIPLSHFDLLIQAASENKH
jgi:hypothetical protein